MKTAIIMLTIIFTQWLNAQEIDTLFNPDANPSFILIERGHSYLNDTTIYVKHKVIHKFEKEVENPLDDEFWPKTPGKLWDSNKRFYLVTLNDKGGYHLFVVSEGGYNNFEINEYFRFIIFGIDAITFSDLGHFNKQQIRQFYKKNE